MNLPYPQISITLIVALVCGLPVLAGKNKEAFERVSTLFHIFCLGLVIFFSGWHFAIIEIQKQTSLMLAETLPFQAPFFPCFVLPILFMGYLRLLPWIFSKDIPTELPKEPDISDKHNA